MIKNSAILITKATQSINQLSMVRDHHRDPLRFQDFKQLRKQLMKLF